MAAATVLAILNGTPGWVWALLGVLVLLGLQATRPRRIALRRALITPVVFVAWGLGSLALHASAATMAAWLAAAGLGAALALITTRLDGVTVDRGRSTLAMPGSWLPLARYLTIFLARYGLAVAAVRLPAARETLVVCDLAVSGLAAGYFCGGLALLVRHYRRAPALVAADALPVAP